MLLPALLPKKLQLYEQSSSDKELLENLLQNPKDLIDFFEYACSDETWSELHDEFTKSVLEWLTDQFFQNRLPKEMAQRAAKSIQEHIGILKSFLPKDILVAFKDKTFSINSLLLGSSSDFFHDLLLKECRDKNQTTLAIKNVSEETFYLIEEFIFTGEVANLWRKTQAELMNILKEAAELRLKGLCDACEVILKRYIDRGNVIDMLIMAHEHRLLILKDACIDIIDTLNYGVRLEKTAIDNFSFTFLEFQPRSLDIFEKVRIYITHLSCGGILTQFSEFSDVIKRTPKLFALDISRSQNFSDRLNDIPQTLRELDISKCEWLTDANLRKIIQICPQLENIKLISNVQLTFAAWSELQKLKALKSLDISRCHQIEDKDFKIITLSCRGVTELKLEECKRVTEKAFFDLTKRIPALTILSLSRCNTTDSSLIEIASWGSNLTQLDLIYCDRLTEKGIFEAVRLCPSLRFLNISHCHVSKEIVEKIKEINPLLFLTL